jgi:hypothetical protein
MSVLSIQPTFPVFTDIDGQPLEDGYIFIGQANQNPITNPISVFFNPGLTVLAGQPIRTIGGYPANAGTPGRLYVNSDYSIQVQNKNGSVVYSAPEALERYSGDLISFTGFKGQIGTLADLADDDGSDWIGFEPSGAGSTARSVQDKLRDVVSVKDFGAVGDGVTSDSAALNAAYASLPSTGGKIYFPKGKYLLTQAHDFSNPVMFVGEGCSATPGADAASQVIKAASVNGPVITVRGLCSGFVDIGFDGQSGNIGNGLQINCGRSLIRNVSSHRMGQDGVRIGDPVTPINCNLMTIDGLYCRSNGRDGLHISDTDGTMPVGGPNANGGTIQKVETSSNGRDGIRVYNAWYLTIIGDVPQSNTGVGLHLINNGAPAFNGSRYHTIVGGEQNEGNSGGNIVSSSFLTTFLGVHPGPTYTNTDVFPTYFSAAGGLTVVGASFTRADLSPVIASSGSGTTFYPFIVRNQANSSNGRGVGIEFQPPDATDNFRTGGRIRVEQATTNKDYMAFSVNDTGAQSTLLVLNSIGVSVGPGTNNTTILGTPSARWSEVFAINGTINTSDERQKQQVRELSDAERAVAVRLKGLIRAFKWNDAVEKKGDGARIHVGVMAQEVKSAFEAEGLVAEAYGVFCYDEWEAEYEPEYEEKIVTYPDVGKVTEYVETGAMKLVRPAGNSYGVRYEELLAFIISAI